MSNYKIKASRLCMLAGIVLFLISMGRPLVRPKPLFNAQGERMKDAGGHLIYDPASQEAVQKMVLPYQIALFASFLSFSGGIVLFFLAKIKKENSR